MADFSGFQVLIAQQQIDQEIESKIDRTQSFRSRDSDKNKKNHTNKGSPTLNPKLRQEEFINEQPAIEQYAKSNRFSRIVSAIFIKKKIIFCSIFARTCS